MKSLPRIRSALIVGLSLGIIIILAACAPDADSEIISPELGPRLMAAEAASVVEAAPAEEIEQPLLADLSEDEIVAGLSDEMVAALSAADPENGENLALINGCIGCHALDPEAQMTGPTWYNMGNTAVSRAEGVSPAVYLYQSITAPNDYVVADYAQGLMPLNYSETIGDEDMADLVAYLLAQQEAVPAE